MKVILTRTTGRTRMICRRADGTFTAADVGPSVPGHDLAHFIVEQRLRLPVGFFVSVARGYSIEQLADAATIRSLGPEPYVAEVLARALGELATGACRIEQFPERVSQELGQMRLPVPVEVSVALARRMLRELQELIGRFEALRAGESMELDFDVGPARGDRAGVELRPKRHLDGAHERAAGSTADD